MAKVFKLYKNYVDPDISLRKFKKIINSSENHDIYDYLNEPNPIYSRFTPIDILFEYEDKEIKQFKYTLIDTITLTIHGESQPTEEFINKVIFRVMLLKPQEFNKNLDIVMFLSNYKKKINFKSKEPLGVNEVNSGVSTIYYNGNNQTIAIFREEECLKVLIHELIHAYNKDNNDYKNPELENKLDCVKDTIEFNEAYVEFNACIYNSICILLEKNNYNFDTGLLETMMKKEISHSIKQVAKILKYYNYNNINEFIEPKVKKYKLKEDTNVVAYYIIKLFILDRYKLYMNKSIEFIFSDPDFLVNPSLKRRINYRLKQEITDNSLKMCYY